MMIDHNYDHDDDDDEKGVISSLDLNSAFERSLRQV